MSPSPIDPKPDAGSPPESDVVISSRARIARNMSGFPFVNRASAGQRREIVNLAREVIGRTEPDGLMWVDLESAEETERRLLVERHLISAQLAGADGERAVAITRDESLSVMVNEEDHLRIQVLAPGAGLADALRRADAFDDRLERDVDYAFDSRYGFLTACPTNVGTGMRLSVMMHLPALKITGDIDRVRRAAADMNLAVRGYYGEGSDAAGDFYQVSNQVTLGLTEDDLLARLADDIAPRVVEYERHARTRLMKNNRDELEDRVHRALGTLRAARLLEGREAMKLLSRVRLGVWLGLLEDVPRDAVSRLFLQVQPAHLRFDAGPANSAELDDAGLRRRRADVVRQALGGS